jgi:hypothetical protein
MSRPHVQTECNIYIVRLVKYYLDGTSKRLNNVPPTAHVMHVSGVRKCLVA